MKNSTDAQSAAYHRANELHNRAYAHTVEAKESGDPKLHEKAAQSHRDAAAALRDPKAKGSSKTLTRMNTGRAKLNDERAEFHDAEAKRLAGGGAAEKSAPGSSHNVGPGIGGGSKVGGASVFHSMADAHAAAAKKAEGKVGLKPPLTSRKAAPTVESSKYKPDYDRLAGQAKAASEAVKTSNRRPEWLHDDAAHAHGRAAKAASGAGLEKEAAMHKEAQQHHQKEAEAAAKGGGGDNHPRDDHGRFASK